ncbi:hypothetical protein MJO28_006787 [Puccinia striiformis f. sp. tritici]|uniref:Uncharacterized protein n=1 Tax=Puccinia striiformis f. sp. tritici TaxID=168172 RepID=A0ACC0EIV8_9BASI|nr:hypothetical protein MJO28_006787 [Puccinia striiformis f. sp. tritici]
MDSIFAKGTSLERGELRRLGLNLGVSTALFDGVARFGLSLETAAEFEVVDVVLLDFQVATHL